MLPAFLYKTKLIVNQYISILFVLVIALLFNSCGGHSMDAPDVSDISIQLKSSRLDQQLYQIDTNNLQEGVTMLKEKYPEFLPFYIGNLLPFVAQAPIEDTLQRFIQPIGHLLTEPDFRGLFDTVAIHFPDVKKEDAHLVKGMKYMKHYFPAYKVPEVVYFITGLNNWTAITYNDTIAHKTFLGIGLDMYLGPEYPFYASVGIPFYVSKRLKPEYIPVNAFRSVYEDMYAFNMEGASLLEMMTQKGKEAYFLKKILPDVEDSLLFGFSGVQVQWCQENEAHIYNYFAEHSLLYETNWQKILRYVNDGPNTPGMPDGAPGNIGSWLGYRIVKQFAEKNNLMQLPQILTAKDGQYLLQAAQYKPR